MAYMVGGSLLLVCLGHAWIEMRSKLYPCVVNCKPFVPLAAVMSALWVCHNHKYFWTIVRWHSPGVLLGSNLPICQPTTLSPVENITQMYHKTVLKFSYGTVYCCDIHMSLFTLISLFMIAEFKHSNCALYLLLPASTQLLHFHDHEISNDGSTRCMNQFGRIRWVHLRFDNTVYLDHIGLFFLWDYMYFVKLKVTGPLVWNVMSVSSL